MNSFSTTRLRLHRMLAWTKVCLFYLFLAVVVPALMLVFLEVGLRLCDIGTSSNLLRPCTVGGSPAFCDTARFTSQFVPGPAMERFSAPFSIPAEKLPGTFRIVVMGQSAAEGFPEPSYGFARFLEVMLQHRFPSIKFEVINSSITAINSHVILPMARELVRYKADLFILYFGSTEVVGPYGAGTVFTPIISNLAIIRATIFIRSTRIGQLLASYLESDVRRLQTWRGMSMFLDQQIPADAPSLAKVYENFSANLRDIIEVASSGGARILLSTVATNVKDCAPFASMHRAGLSAADRDRWEEHVDAGERLEKSGQCAAALQKYALAAAIDDRYADLHFRIARCHWHLGDYPAAKTSYARARDLDTLRFRADTNINAIIRSVALSQASKVDFLDTEAALENASVGSILGNDIFYEHMHFRPKGNYLFARSILSRIESMLPKQAQQLPENAGILSEPAAERLLALTRYDRRRVAIIVLGELQRPPYTNQLNKYDYFLKILNEVRTPIDSDAQTAAEYRWALDKRPNDRLLHLNYGLFLKEHHDARAVEHLTAARPFDDTKVLPDSIGTH